MTSNHFESSIELLGGRLATRRECMTAWGLGRVDFLGNVGACGGKLGCRVGCWSAGEGGEKWPA